MKEFSRNELEDIYIACPGCHGYGGSGCTTCDGGGQVSVFDYLVNQDTRLRELEDIILALKQSLHPDC